MDDLSGFYVDHVAGRWPAGFAVDAECDPAGLFADFDRGDLDDQQFAAKCWISAIAIVVAPTVELEFPSRLYAEPDED